MKWHYLLPTPQIYHFRPFHHQRLPHHEANRCMISKGDQRGPKGSITLFPNHILFWLPTTIRYHQVPTIKGLQWLPWGLKIDDHWTYPTITISDPEACDQTLIESNNCIKICIMVINNNISQSQIHSLKPVQWSGALFQFISYLGCQLQSSTTRYPPLRVYDGYPGA